VRDRDSVRAAFPPERAVTMRVSGTDWVVGGWGPRQIVEILLGHQNRHALVVDVEKVLQPAEAVGAAQALDRIVGETNAVAPSQSKEELRLETAFDMDVQLALRQAVD
jgi:2,4-dienoyl-CoA reductase-like NADH-dependent reductase (Old Yellow Enzyme family)